MKDRGRVTLLLCPLILAVAFPAYAHTMATGLATLTVVGSTLTYRLTLVLGELPDEPARLIASAIDGDPTSVQRVVTALRERVRVQADTAVCRPGRASLQGSALGVSRVVLELTLHCPVDPARLVIRDDCSVGLGSVAWASGRAPTPGGLRMKRAFSCRRATARCAKKAR